jgi:hypothetical protein
MCDEFGAELLVETNAVQWLKQRAFTILYSDASWRLIGRWLGAVYRSVRLAAISRNATNVSISVDSEA